ncbi:unannotated protein [freshwater metagenome]|uniref:Unannotated protein n=1 Tax=freshwater metagenome TaxID=449393 RepID=A0A6J7J6A8_9ZZZZ
MHRLHEPFGVPRTGFEILALSSVLCRHPLGTALLLHDMGELMGEQLLATRAIERRIGREEDLPIAGERFGIHRTGEGLRPAPFVDDHLGGRSARRFTDRLPHVLRHGNTACATRGTRFTLPC